MEVVEKDQTRQALEQSVGNKTLAAELLGLTRETLGYRIEKYSLESETA